MQPARTQNPCGGGPDSEGGQRQRSGQAQRGEAGPVRSKRLDMESV